MRLINKNNTVTRTNETVNNNINESSDKESDCSGSESDISDNDSDVYKPSNNRHSDKSSNNVRYKVTRRRYRREHEKLHNSSSPEFPQSRTRSGNRT